MFTVTKITEADCERLASLTLREEDQKEHDAVSTLPFRESIRDFVRMSEEAYIVVAKDGTVVSVGGVQRIGKIGVPWLLSTEAVNTYPTAGLRMKEAVDRVRPKYDLLMNFVGVSNVKVQSLLRRIGFTIVDTNPVYFRDKDYPFYLFHMKGVKNV